MTKTVSTLLPCEIIGPKDAKEVVIWLHGLGASGHDFVPIVPMLRRPQTKFVFPHAPRRAVTINMGMVMPSWYDILHLEAGSNRESEAEVLQSTSQINALIEAELKRGVAPQQMILAGFSQGGAMALHTGVRYPKTLGGIMVLSAYELRAHTREKEATAANQSTPMLFCHGRQDAVVPMARGQAAFNTYNQGGRDALWEDYPMGHEVCGAEVNDIAQWFAQRLDR